MPMRYWSLDNVERLKHAASFSEIGEIAVETVRSIGTPVHQVCGPISSGGLGCMEKNMMVFRAAINVLLGRGYVVFNQLPLQDAMLRHYAEWRKEHPGPDEYCWPILEDIYAPIFESGCVECGCFIPNWQGSKGTQWERDTLQNLGIKIFDIPEEWLVFRVGT